MRQWKGKSFTPYFSFYLQNPPPKTNKTSVAFVIQSCLEEVCKITDDIGGLDNFVCSTTIVNSIHQDYQLSNSALQVHFDLRLSHPEEYEIWVTLISALAFLLDNLLRRMVMGGCDLSCRNFFFLNFWFAKTFKTKEPYLSISNVASTFYLGGVYRNNNLWSIHF